ncbi:hypothetical protein PROFUN_11321 [Planoprotostelium fungivorum]|uniref:Uncharacterized protein n=1 Tax=Planoprotostelium fungivorum TaxID=1890364 RepID=A0A2P6N2M2_9EUKA|nr:hypothetical protein PROFUN_11321 [Planoprotostelium fungivorum]
MTSKHQMPRSDKESQKKAKVPRDSIIASGSHLPEIPSSVPTKEQLLKVARGLTHKKRIEYASKIALRHKNAPQLNSLIESLRKHEPLTLPSQDADDDFVDVLPSSDRDVEGHFTEEQLAIFMAASAGSEYLPLLREEVLSSSLLLKQKVVFDYVRLQQDDQAILETFREVVLNTKRLMMREAADRRKTSLVDAMYKELLKDEPATAAHFVSVLRSVLSSPQFLNSSSPELLSTILKDQTNRRTIEPKAIIGQRHLKAIVDLLEEELSKVTTAEETALVWGEWYPFLKYAGDEEKEYQRVIQLTLQYTILNKNVDMGQTIYNVSSITSSVNGSRRKIVPSEYYEFIEKNYFEKGQKVAYRRYLITLLDSWQQSLPQFTQFVQRFMDKVTDKKKLLTETSNRLISLSNLSSLLDSTHASAAEYLKVVVQYMSDEKMKENVVQWNRVFCDAFSCLSTLRDTVKEQYGSIIAKAFVDIWSQRPKESNDSTYSEDLCQLTNTWNNCANVHSYQQLLPLFLELSEKYYGSQIKALDATTTAWISQFLNVAYQRIQSRKKKDKYRSIAVDIHKKVFSHVMKLFDTIPIHWRHKLDLVSNQSLFPSQEVLIMRRIPAEEWNEHTNELYRFTQRTREVLTKLRLLIDGDEEAKRKEIDSDFQPREGMKHMMDTLDQLITKLSKRDADQLLELRDPSRENHWKDMGREIIVPNRTERATNLGRMLTASLLNRTPDKIVEVLRLIQDRTKNETPETRNSMLSILSTYFSSPLCDAKETTDAMNEMMEASLAKNEIEIPEMDEDYVLDLRTLTSSDQEVVYFLDIAQKALGFSVNEKDEEKSKRYFAFGASMQWRMTNVLLGPTNALKYFRLCMPSSHLSVVDEETRREKIDSERRSLTRMAEAYTTYFTEEPRTGRESVELYLHFFNSAPHVTILNHPVVIDLLERVTKETNGEAISRDPNSDILQLESDDPAVRLYISLRKIPNAIHFPILREYARCLLKSRQALKCGAVFDLYKGEKKYVPVEVKTHYDVVQLRKKSALDGRIDIDRYVHSLLNISQSAIRIKFVWRHLIQYRQDLLDEYLQSRKSYRGVFAIEEKKATRGRKSTPTTAAEIYNQEKQKDATMLAQLVDGQDHPDLYIIPVVYGLHKLYQDQTKTLAHAHKLRFENEKLVPKIRNVSTRRWTIMPCVSYPEMVSVINERGADEDRAAWPAAVLKSLYRGLLRVDDIIPPLYMLLSPTTLSKEEFATEAVYSISRVTKYLTPKQLIEILRTLMGEKRRKELKITHMKEITRLLSSKPNKDSLRLIVDQLNQTNLHRDLRISALSVLSKFLFDKELGAEAWEALKQGAKRNNIDELISLLTAVPTGEAFSVDFHQFNVLTPQLKEQVLDLLGKVIIPTKYAARYAEEIIIPMVNQPSLKDNSKLEDFRILATFCAYRWGHYIDHDKIAQLLVNLLTRTDAETMRRYQNHLSILTTQSELASVHLFKITGSDGKASPQHILNVVQSLCNAIQASSNVEDQMNWYIRPVIVQQLQRFMLKIPNRRTHPINYFAPLQESGPMFEQMLLTYELNQLPLSPSVEKYVDLYKKILRVFINRPTTVQSQWQYLISKDIGSDLFVDRLLDLTFDDPVEERFHHLLCFTVVEANQTSSYKKDLTREDMERITKMIERVPLRKNKLPEENILTSIISLLRTIRSKDHSQIILSHYINKLNEDRETNILMTLEILSAMESNLARVPCDTISVLVKALLYALKKEKPYASKLDTIPQSLNETIWGGRIALQRIMEDLTSGKLLREVNQDMDHLFIPKYMECTLNWLTVWANTTDSADQSKFIDLFLELDLFCAIDRYWGYQHNQTIAIAIKAVVTDRHTTIKIDSASTFAESLISREADTIQLALINDIFTREEIKKAASTETFSLIRQNQAHDLHLMCLERSVPQAVKIYPSMVPVQKALFDSEDPFIRYELSPVAGVLNEGSSNSSKN